ncbi:hypothetical protein [Nitrosospira sp. Nsp11]|uniref:hypothetical protein n=1 Tax=Nitrosospira sp. Nsp11 TaxID=1855338 RepID=UPI001C4A3EA9|nr:hypothetical protein [Nitrosospira sp. Nsp11]
MTGVNHPAENPVHMFVADFAFGVLGKFRELLKEALHLGPELKAPAGVPFQSLGHDTR